MRRGGTGTCRWHGGSSVSRDDGAISVFWHKAIALLDDRERCIDTTSCMLPSDAAVFFQPQGWELPEVAPHRAALNYAKGLLDGLDNTAWDSYAQTANYAEFIRRDLRKQFQVELATVAWAKMYELIVRCNLLPDDGTALRQCAAKAAVVVAAEATPPASNQPSPSPSPAQAEASNRCPTVVTVHLCEAPGGFVAACNHFLRTHRPGWCWDWLAVSLNPYYGGNDQFAMVDDDAFMRATLPHWCFGADDSGDVRRVDNIRAIWAEAHHRCAAAGVRGAMLVTADGAIDTSMVPHAQELVNASLHFTEVVAALGMLVAGGSMLWKGFTLFEHPSLCALHLMGCVFEQVTVCKPCTSKPCNSELYVVGRGFRGIPGHVLEVLLSKCGEDVFSERAMLPLAVLPAPFLESALAAAQHFAECTSEAIRDALDKSGLPNSGPTATAIRRVKERFAAEWFLRMQLLRLERRFFVAPHEAIDGSNNSTSNVLGRRRELLGTLQERQDQYRRRRNDLGLDGGAMVAAAALQGQLGSSYDSGGAAGCSSLGSSPSGGMLYGQYSRSPGATGQRVGGGISGLGNGISGSAPIAAAYSGGLGGGEEGAAAEPIQVSGTIAKLMAKMGYKEGVGLGRHAQGIATAVPAVGNTGRAGLGLGLGLGSSQDVRSGVGARSSRWMSGGPAFGVGAEDAGACGAGLGWSGPGGCEVAHGSTQPGLGLGRGLGLGMAAAAGLGLGVTDTSAEIAALPDECWEPAPDTKVLLNDVPLMAAEVAAWAKDTAAANSRGAGASAGSSLGRQVPPVRLTKSKMVIDDHVLVALRRVRDTYNAAAAAAAAATNDAAGCDAAAADGGPTSSGSSGAPRVGAAEKLCAHVGPVCVAPRRRGAGSVCRSFWKLASLDSALSVCRLAAACAVKAGAQPHALDLSLRSAGATDYLLQTVLPQGAGAGGRTSKRGPHRRRSSDRSSRSRSRSNHSVLEDHSGSTSSSSSNSSDGEALSIRSSSCEAASGEVPVLGGIAPEALSLWSATMLATPASAAYVAQLQQPDKRKRVRLQSLAGLDPQAVATADPLDVFTPNTSRTVAQSAAASDAMLPTKASASVTSAEPAAAAARRGGAGCWLVVGDLGALRRARCGSPSSSCGPLEGEYDTLYRRRLLWEAATALSVLAPRGCAVLRLGDCLTMFSASVLYILHRSFGQLAIVKPFASCACSPERFVVGIGRLEDDGVAASQLLAGLAAVREVEVPRAALAAAPLLVPPSLQQAVGSPVDVLRGAAEGTDGSSSEELLRVAVGADTSPVGSASLEAAGSLELKGRDEGMAGAEAAPVTSAVWPPAQAGGAVRAATELGPHQAPAFVAAAAVAAACSDCSIPLAPLAEAVAEEQPPSSPSLPPASDPVIATEQQPAHAVLPAAQASTSDLAADSMASATPSPTDPSTGLAAVASSALADDTESLEKGSREAVASAVTNTCSAVGPQEAVPMGLLGPMAITGVAPLTVCVAGEFYVYLAARTQELARRQVHACEAVLAAASAAGSVQRQGGPAGGRAGPAPSGRVIATEDQYQEIVRRAEAVLAGRREQAEGEDGASSAADKDHDLRRKYGGMFTRGSQAFTVGSAPVASSWARAAALQRTAQTASAAAGPAVDAWVEGPATGLGFAAAAKANIAAAAGPPVGEGAPSWSYTRQGATPGRGTNAAASNSGAAAGAFGQRAGDGGGGGGGGSGAGYGRRPHHVPGSYQCNNGGGFWRAPSSYGASPPSASYTPLGANSPSGASTPYGASPPYAKGFTHARSPPGGCDGGSGGGFSRSPPAQYSSSWQNRTSGMGGSHQHQRHQQQPGRLSCSWERGSGGDGNKGGGGGHITHRVAGEAALEAIQNMVGGEGAGACSASLGSSASGGSGRAFAWAWGGKSNSRREGHPASNQSGRQLSGGGAGGSTRARQQSRANSWRSSSGTDAQKGQGGDASGVGVGQVQQGGDEEGWERVVGTGRRRA